ncbi:MAG TPA: FecR domain-containing protein [Turneriella sp.]|nr:FecR domain-containing protein [Turneriella sp.]
MLRNTILVATLLAPAFAFAGEAGKITFLSGQVDVDSGKGWQKANLGATLNESDKIRTGSRGTALINLKSGAVLKMKSDSQIILSQVGNATTVDVEAGALFSKVGKRGNGQSFRIRAQTMVAAVREIPQEAGGRGETGGGPDGGHGKAAPRAVPGGVRG